MEINNFKQNDMQDSKSTTDMGYAEVDLSAYTKPKSEGLFTLTLQWIRTRSFRFWSICTIGSLSTFGVYAIYTAINNADPSQSIGSQYKNDTMLSVRSPAIMG